MHLNGNAQVEEIRRRNNTGVAGCDASLTCVIHHWHTILNTSFCKSDGEVNFDYGRIGMRFDHFRLWPDHVDNAEMLEVRLSPGFVDCRWYFVLHQEREWLYFHERFFTVTFNQLHSSNPGFNTGNFSLEYAEMDIPSIFHGIDVERLLRSDVIVQSPVTVVFRLKSQAPHLTDSLLIRVSKTTKGELFRQMPEVKVSDRVGCVTSPTHDGIKQGYPSKYKGSFSLELQEEHSVVVTFHSFNLGANQFGISACGDFMTFVVGNRTQWKKCGVQPFQAKVYRDSISVKLVSQTDEPGVGFKMMYAVVPRIQEPQEVSEGVFNCSVSHFKDFFSPILHCNMVVECAGGEDERDCEFLSQECGRGYFHAGTKCYRFVKRQPGISWNYAYHECRQSDEHLVTMATPKELDAFQRMVLTKKDSFPCLYIGARQTAGVYDSMPSAMEMMYRRVWRWADDRTAFFFNINTHDSIRQMCAMYSLPVKRKFLNVIDCVKSNLECDFFCEKTISKIGVNGNVRVLLTSVTLSEAVWKENVVLCPRDHVVRDYLSCDPDSQCGVEDYVKSCKTDNVDVLMFVCEPSLTTIHYSLVCDREKHCPDNSDEDFCNFDPCPAFRCSNGQCLSTDHFCDGEVQCFDFEDEKYCESTRMKKTGHEVPSLPPPFIVHMVGKGLYTLTQMNNSYECPSTHFLCPGGVCLPLYLRCNNVDDCSGREDEAGCETYTCPGFYRCRRSQVCLFPDQLCDGVRHCPHQDDETLCNTDYCPHVCQCQGLAFVCSHSFNASFYSDLRYLDASSSGMFLGNIKGNRLLVYADLSRCGIHSLQKLTIPNLRHLDLSQNKLSHINMEHFFLLQNLKVLILSRNNISYITSDLEFLSHRMSSTLSLLDLSYSFVKVYNGTLFKAFHYLTSINLSWSYMTEIADGGFQTTPELETLDTRNSRLTSFPTDVLSNLTSLKTVYTDTFKLCCQAMLPEEFDMKNCHVKADLLASCEDLLKSNMYRIFLWIFAALAILGNIGSFVARVYLDSSGLGSFGVFVINLTVADLFMGIYLAVVGTADLAYQGRYIFHDDQWKNSMACRTAGFLSLLSCEVSAFNICLITLDRFLVLRFPFSQFHFGRSSAIVSCVAIWTIGCVLAAIPLLPATSHWQFFSKIGICIPLPFTSSVNFPGYTYSFAVMILLNFFLFTAIACGQAVIYRSVQANSLVSTNKDSAAKNATVARRLTTVVVSDFLCWFPIGLLGVLASTGTQIQDELNVAMAIFVLPVNSALNPFLYTLNVLIEKRRKAREANLLLELESLILCSP